ncbi:MAG TPA: LemA family protein [Salinivirgaceae bacterium]|nr:LemA family protein [Salinivirgaceae bacterium]HQA75890.1 LemA family protein [Salinivirgaceae bacterium]
MSTNKVKTKGTGCLASVLIIIPILIIFLVLGIMAYSSYNGMVSSEESVDAQWGKVESNYQRRLDLVENLVSVVKGYAGHENTTLVGVIEARSKATGINISGGDGLTPENIEQFQLAQDGLSSALSRLMVVVEQYPDLKASENYQRLMNDLMQIEKDILIERNAFNDEARKYNTYIRKFPKIIFAKMFGFNVKGYFKASEEAQKAPKVGM